MRDYVKESLMNGVVYFNTEDELIGVSPNIIKKIKVERIEDGKQVQPTHYSHHM